MDPQIIRLALKELENRDSPLPSSSRVNALKLVHIFKTQYNRSADKFVSSMLAQKNKKVRRVLLKGIYIVTLKYPPVTTSRYVCLLYRG